MQVVEHMGEPFQRVDAYDVATFEQGIEDGVIDGSAVTFAEQVVFGNHPKQAVWVGMKKISRGLFVRFFVVVW